MDTEPYVDHNPQIAGVLVFVTSFLGIIANGIVVFWVCSLPSMQTSFGRMTRSQATADFLHDWSFFLYMAPMLTFNLKSWNSHDVSSICGHLLLIFYDACNACHFFMALNRTCAIFFPIQYPHIFSHRNVTIMNTFCWLSAIVPSIWTYRIADCRFYYLDAIWGYTFDDNPLCGKIGWYYDFIKSVTTILIIGVLDLVTFIKCRIHGAQLVAKITDAQARAKRRSEIHYATQVCLQGCIFILELFSFFLFVNYVDSKMAKFALTTIAWISVHALDGMITIYFNKEFRAIIRRKRDISATHSVGQKATHSSSQN
ncbi:unnamed protein product, partial [Mesorhabditis spiculigera]